MTDKEKELEALKKEYLRRDDIINKEYPVDHNSLSGFLYTEQIMLGKIKALNKWFQQELDRIYAKYE